VHSCLIHIILFLFLALPHLSGYEIDYSGPYQLDLDGYDLDANPKSLSITISGPNEFPGGRAKLTTTLDGDYNGWAMRFVNPDGTVADEVVNNNADCKSDPDIAQSLVQIKWEYQEAGAWQDIGYLSVGEPALPAPVKALHSIGLRAQLIIALVLGIYFSSIFFPNA